MNYSSNTQYLEGFKSPLGYEGKYLVNRNGEVFSIKMGRLLKPYRKTKGYLQIDLFDMDGKRHVTSMHILVMSVFGGRMPLWAECINHKDGNKQNNHIDNLEWCTYKQNTQHAIMTGLKKNFPNNGYPKRPVIQYDLGLNFIKEYTSILEASKETGIGNIGAVCLGKRNKAGGFKWGYKHELQ